jgi:methionyl-tRNA synthetase
MHVYVTTPIYYVNDRPHIGHCYTTLLADCYARFHRLAAGSGGSGEPTATGGDAVAGGDGGGGAGSGSGSGSGTPTGPGRVFFLTGTDEHAEKVVTTAAEHGLSALAWADQNSAAFKATFEELGYTFDDFIRTTQPRHTSKVGEYIRTLMDSGDVYLGEYEGWYDVNDEAYVTETKAKEQNYLAANGKPLVRRREKNYYFKLSGYQKWLEAALASGEVRVEPEARRNEVLGRLREGLDDVPISRPITDDAATQFGIRMPGDESHRIYVWIDALFNYLTAVDTPERRELWPPTVHMIGKEIVWFHAVIWPALLKALKKPQPHLLYAHSHYVREGKKMSKSLGNFIDLETIRAYTTRYGRDALRWYLATQGPLGATDADFAHGKFVEVYNAELANGIGNCTSRVANMIEKYFGGVVPEHAGHTVFSYPRRDITPGNAPGLPLGEPPAMETVFNWPEETQEAAGRAARLMRQCQIGEALLQGIALVSRVDAFINVTQPFKIAKQTDAASREHLGSILYCCAEALRVATVLLSPALPTSMRAVQESWGCVPPRGATLPELARFAGPYGLKPGAALAKTPPLFMRADVAEPAPG